MRIRVWLLLVIVLVGSALGCMRHIPVYPEMAHSENDIDWRIEQEPQVAPSPAHPPAEPVAP
jgi:hypothetical protein